MNPEIEQAIQEYIGEQFIEWLQEYITHTFQSWPVVGQILQAETKPERLKKFMIQVYLANQAFFGTKEGDPGFLRFAIANLSESSDPTAETALESLEQRRQSELVKQADLATAWQKLLQHLGAEIEELDRTKPKEATRSLIADLSDLYSASDWQIAVGAYASGEVIEQLENQMFIKLLKRFGVAEKDLHVLNKDVNINHVLDKIVFDPQAKSLVLEGCRRQLEVHQEFLNQLVKYLHN